MIILAYLEFLVKNKVSYHMLANNLCALKANFIMYGLDHSLIDHQKVKYFMKSVKINRPLVFVPRNIMSIHMLRKLIKMCDQVPCGSVFKAVFLIAFFGFLWISNIAPHSASIFDSSGNLTLNDITISNKFMKIALKWTKTIQSRDKIHMVSLPRLQGSILCPVAALQKII